LSNQNSGKLNYTGSVDGGITIRVHEGYIEAALVPGRIRLAATDVFCLADPVWIKNDGIDFGKIKKREANFGGRGVDRAASPGDWGVEFNSECYPIYHIELV